MPFKKEDCDEAIQWAQDTLALIENEREWLPNNSSSYYCSYLCGQRNHACEYKPQPISNKSAEDNRHYNPETDSYEQEMKNAELSQTYILQQCACN